SRSTGSCPGLATGGGAVPVRGAGRGAPLPAGAAREWAAWGRRRNYLFGALEPAVREDYAALRFPVRALHIADDLYAPRRGIEALVGFYGGPPEGLTRPPPRAGGPPPPALRGGPPRPAGGGRGRGRRPVPP